MKGIHVGAAGMALMLSPIVLILARELSGHEAFQFMDSHAHIIGWMLLLGMLCGIVGLCMDRNKEETRRKPAPTRADVLKSMNKIADDLHDLTAMVNRINEQEAKR